jgi:hypothetical protein
VEEKQVPTDLKLLAEALAGRKTEIVRVTAEGFHVGAATYVSLRATIASWVLVRKLFQGRRLVCRSNDGETSTDGKSCDTCADRLACLPRLRLSLANASGTPPGAASGPCGRVRLGALLVELNVPSCHNFLAYARLLAAAHTEVPEIPARLTVLRHDRWGEVAFATDPDPLPDSP